MQKQKESQLTNNVDSQLLGVIIAVFAVILTIVLFALWRRRIFIGHHVLFMGLCNAGKTCLFARLLHTKFINTYTSIKENIGVIHEKNGSVKIVDIPGHERLRYKYFEKFKNSTKGLVFVIDSTTIQNNLRDVAEFLYTLLSDSTLNRNTPILILCNKQDQVTAKDKNEIKLLLQKELNILRVTKTSQLESIDASSSNVYLGKTGKNFEFSDLERRISFAECHTLIEENEAAFEELTLWLMKLV